MLEVQIEYAGLNPVQFIIDPRSWDDMKQHMQTWLEALDMKFDKFDVFVREHGSYVWSEVEL
jgi:hypothetical protein